MFRFLSARAIALTPTSLNLLYLKLKVVRRWLSSTSPLASACAIAIVVDPISPKIQGDEATILILQGPSNSSCSVRANLAAHECQKGEMIVRALHRLCDGACPSSFKEVFIQDQGGEAITGVLQRSRDGCCALRGDPVVPEIQESEAITAAF